MHPNRTDIARLYESLRLIRRVEEAIADVYPTDRIKSPIHLSIGQEAVSVGVIDTLAPADIVAASYRCHAAYLAKGGDLKAMIAELFGKAAGVAGGKGGSMHLIAPEVNMLGASAVVATQIPLAVGAALTQKMKGTGAIVAVFLGDGATEEGVFHESLNFAALKRLPVLFVCENNGYSIHTPLRARWATDRLTERVATYGLPAARIADGDVFAIRDQAAGFVASIRDGRGPAFMEVQTYRWKEHVGPNADFDAGYRPESEARPWIDNDQLPRLGALIDAEERAAIDARVETAIAEAFAFAEAASPPPLEDLLAHVHA
ncbi:MAG: thiamine pyrophosphate-dependent dehydrogenase E1 component subunit alpha [Rhodospirillaceae bacterium]|nr:thiamine pyrophosphate-dependent dehydrogenase E1 component subunit alpha [Rhodospirillaceae bacterium]